MEKEAKIAYDFYMSGDFQKALERYKLILEEQPYIAINYFNVACMYHFLKDYDNAAKYYYFAIKMDPSNMPALNNFGVAFYECKKFDKALKIFETALAKAPNHPEAFHHMGVLQREYLGDLELSELYLKKALRLDPKYLPNSYQLALTYKKAEKTDKAIAALENCLELDPAHEPSRKELSRIICSPPE
jgi:tetratricopeptide (TPR) repeat protein